MRSPTSRRSLVSVWPWMMLWLLVLACGEQEPGTPSIDLEPADGDSVPTSFVVRGLPGSWYRDLQTRPPQDSSWTDLLAVHVELEGAGNDRPPMLGRHEVHGRELRFLPRFPLEPGRAYRARLDLGAGPAPYDGPSPKIVEASFRLPAREAVKATRCLAVFPSGDELPENLLRLYLEFSGPMTRGVSREHISLERLAGPETEPPAGANEPAPDPFVEITQELWDPGQRRITLLLDPGRIKRGLRPHDEAGPPLVAGNSYRLVVAEDWPDARGEPLAAGCEKTFQVAPADRSSPDPEHWQIRPPVVGSRGPLRLVFDGPLDHSLLIGRLAVEDPAQRPVEGAIRIGDAETTWSLSPHEPWREGRYRIHIEPTLEDPSGNRIGKIFDQPMGGTGGAPPASTILEFEPAPAVPAP